MTREMKEVEVTAMAATKYIGIVLFPSVEELDFVGPFEVFGGLTFQDREWKAVTISETGEPVKAANGLSVNVDYSFDDAPRLDVILVPGGVGTRTESENPRMVEFVQKAGNEASYVTSVCTGAFILHAAGFLSGKRATTHWGVIQALRDLPDVEVIEERFVHDGKVITSAGVSAGIDMSLYLVSLLKDAQTALNVQKMMEYYPEPPTFAEPALSKAEGATA
jgi:transcriptional regulator GlxA family with amidase domain